MVFTDSEEDDLDAPRLRQEHPKPVPAKTEDRDTSNSTEVTPTPEDEARYSSQSHDEEERPRKRRKPLVSEPERLEWSDEDDINIGEIVYKEFKARKPAAARKKASVSTRKATGLDEESKHDPENHVTYGTTAVGRQRRRKSRARAKTYEDGPSDDDLMEWTTPQYVQERRAKFNERTERLKEAGLQLPPNYDDVDFSDDERLRYLKERPDFPLAKTAAPYKDIELPYSLGLIPAPIAQFLRDYQVKGAAFLHELFVYQKGGILGDDMGLGKTVQVIAFLTAAYGKTGDERDRKRMRKMRKAGKWYPRTLIICPGTLMENWQDEFRRWGWWHTDLYHGNAEHRHEVFLEAQAGMLEVMLTTYQTYRLNKGEINMVQWDCVVADECHQFKERKSDTTKAINEVNALCRIGLTGTAIQNKYEELWTLLNWTNPGRFGPISTWKTSICEPLKLGQSHNASHYQLARARKTAKMLVQNLLPQFFLRRMKTLIQDQLPKKSDRVVFCPLTATQAQAYQNFLNSDIVEHIKNSSDLCDCGSGKKAGWCCHMCLEDGSKWQSWVFPAIANLQKLSNHLAILIPQGTDPADKQAKDLDMLQIAVPDEWRRLYNSRDSILHAANPEFCGKWRVLKKLLNFWHDQGDNKVLVFSHSVRLLKMLQNLFISTSFTVKYLDGSMSYEDRYAAVQDFNTDPTQFVFLISTRAGGVGLNITSANKVVVVDPNWNPSYDLQAQDRAYRIGQTRDVEVFRLVSQGTLEEIVYARQIYKQQQASIGYNASSERRYFQGVQDNKDQKGEIFGLQNLFTFENENVVLRDIVNKTNVAESRADVRVANLELGEEPAADTGDDDDTATSEDGLVRSVKTTEPESEDAAMSHLAAEITGEATKPKSRSNPPLGSDKTGFTQKHDPVQAILSSVGVSYTHENSEVIGSSKVEARLSKRAEEAAEAKRNWDAREQSSKVFLEESQSQSQSNDLVGRVRYKYRPPDAVKRRQFCTMAKWAGYGDDVVEFALVVESWTQARRRECLDRFYRWRRHVLDGLVTVDDDEDVGLRAAGENVPSDDKDGIKKESESEEDDEL